MKEPFYRSKPFLEVTFPAILVAGLLMLESFKPPGPDALLYKGLSENLMNGVGYVDTIRNDEILPTIGHPLILVGFFRLGVQDGRAIGLILLGMTLVFSYLTFRLAKLNSIVSSVLLILLTSIIPTTNQFGVEMSLALSISVSFYFAMLHLKKRTASTSALLGLALALQIFVRPLIWPFMSILALVFIFQSIRSLHFFKMNWVGLLVIFAAYFGTKQVSEQFYGDSRLVSGTYSEIPLYCAFNDYIDLETNYYSSNWNELDSVTKAEALAPLKLPEDGWQERAKTLREEVAGFIQNEPVKAFRGYLFRLSKYTFYIDSISYLLAFMATAIAVVISLRRIFQNGTVYKKLLLLVLCAIPIYIVAIQAVFPYVDSRYLLAPGFYLIFSSVCIRFALKFHRV